MTNRRRFIVSLGAALGTSPFASRAQPAAKIRHVGYLSQGTAASNSAFLAAFKDGLREFGLVDGKNVVVDVRFVGDAAYEFPQIAASMVKAQPNAIVTTCIPSTRAAKSATRDIPLVMSVDGDPVGAGLVASLARPGGNLTGSSTLFEELVPKWLEFMNAAVPGTRPIATLRSQDNLVDPYWGARLEEAAQRIGVGMLPFEATQPADLDGAFRAMNRQGVRGLIVMTGQSFASQIARIIQLANQYRLPGIYGFREFAEAGGLMSYGFSFKEYYGGVARYVAAVLNGTKPADLPVQQPTKIELVINLDAARRLGVTLTPALLARADRLIG